MCESWIACSHNTNGLCNHLHSQHILHRYVPVSVSLLLQKQPICHKLQSLLMVMNYILISLLAGNEHIKQFTSKHTLHRHTKNQTIPHIKLSLQPPSPLTPSITASGQLCHNHKHIHILPSHTRHREKRGDQCVNGPTTIVNTSFLKHTTVWATAHPRIHRQLDNMCPHFGTVPQGHHTYTSPLTDTYNYNKYRPHEEKKQTISNLHWERQHLRYVVSSHTTTRIKPPASHKSNQAIHSNKHV